MKNEKIKATKLIHDLSFEIIKTPYKANKKNYKYQFSINQMLKD